MSEQNTRVILHIGLHKTGTRFLQRDVLRRLDPARFNVNPDDLWPRIRQATRRPDDTAARDAARAAVQRWRASGDRRMLIISEPHISGDMYSHHEDFRQNAAFMKELFPEARIIYVVRNQADWLQSAYRQQLARGASIPIHVFLNHYEGDFRPRIDRWVHGARNLEALSLRFLDIYRTYADAFGEDNVLLLRQEDLRAQQAMVNAAVARMLELDALPEWKKDSGKIQNRSYSALAISLFHPGTLRRLGVPTQRDIGKPVRRLPRLRASLMKIRRAFVQHAFDRMIYKDWDLLKKGGLRERIEAHYAAEAQELRRIAHEKIGLHGKPNQVRTQATEDQRMTAQDSLNT